MIVYVDLVMLLNFSTDLLLLLGTNSLAGYQNCWPRLILSALLGAVYSGLCLHPSFLFLGNPFWYLIFLCLMAAAAFGLQESALRRGALFFLLAMSLSGIAMALHQSRLEILILEAGGLWLLTRISFGDQKIGRRYIPVTVSQGSRRIHFTALVDTGNELRDPVTGEPVMVVAPAQAQALTGLTLQQLQNPAETLLQCPQKGLRLIPYRSIGTQHSMLLSLRFPSVTAGTHHGPALLAFAPEGLGGSSYQALTGGILC